MNSISVIIPAYNAVQYIERCIKSVTVNNGNYEVIIVNDGSTDETLSLCEDLAKSNPQIKIYSKPKEEE